VAGIKNFLAGWLIDGAGTVIRKKILLRVVDGRFAAIKDYSPEDLLGQEHFQDLSHCTLLPPLVDSHVHLFMSGTTDRRVREQQLLAGYDELRPVMERHLRYLFSHGVLAVRDGGDHGGFALRYKAENKLEAGMLLRVAGRAWKKKDRYGGLIGRAPGEGESPAKAYAAESAVVDHVKLVNSGLNSLTELGRETQPQFSKDEIAELVKVAGEHGRKVMVHANGKLPVQLAIEAGCHSVEHGFFMGRENLCRMAERGTVWVPTVFTMKAYADNCGRSRVPVDPGVVAGTIADQLLQLAVARELGVTVALGSDAGSLGVLHGESVVEEMKMFIKAGYSLAETVRCATANGARLLGYDGGLLEVGRVADFLVVRGTPAQMPRKLSYLEGIYLAGEASPAYQKDPTKVVSGK